MRTDAIGAQQGPAAFELSGHPLFTVMPIYILKLLSRDPSPAVNVVAIVVILLSAVPVYLATRLSADTGVAGGRT